jgi:hypothetical protein
LAKSRGHYSGKKIGVASSVGSEGELRPWLEESLEIIRSVGGGEFVDRKAAEASDGVLVDGIRKLAVVEKGFPLPERTPNGERIRKYPWVEMTAIGDSFWVPLGLWGYKRKMMNTRSSLYHWNKRLRDPNDANFNGLLRIVASREVCDGMSGVRIWRVK